MGIVHGFLRRDQVAFTVSLPSLRIRETGAEQAEYPSNTRVVPDDRERDP